LDPDISPASALAQAPRVAEARGATLDQMQQLIAAHTEGRQLGFLGEPRVNVLLLNLDLNQKFPIKNP
jgi:K+-transporting ATPase ATPase C chain